MAIQYTQRGLVSSTHPRMAFLRDLSAKREIRLGEWRWSSRFESSKWPLMDVYPVFERGGSNLSSALSCSTFQTIGTKSHYNSGDFGQKFPPWKNPVKNHFNQVISVPHTTASGIEKGVV